MHLTEDQVTQQLHKLFKIFTSTNDPGSEQAIRKDFRVFARDHYHHAKHIVGMFVK